MLLKKLGDRLRLLRKQTGLSQEKIAFKIGMDRTYYASVENGKRNIFILNLNRIADGLDMSLSEVLCFEEQVRKMRIINTESGSRYIFDIDRSMRDRCLDFAQRIITSENQYNRLSNGQNARIQRTYMGKIAELVFLEWLKYKHIDVDTTEMFTVFEGQENVDSFDFVINGLSIDVKAAYRSNHRNLLINKDQFERLHKDIYVGIKLNAIDTDRDHKICDLNSVTEGTIYGYAEYDFLKKNAKYGYYTESYAYAYPLEKLLSIDRLL